MHEPHFFPTLLIGKEGEGVGGRGITAAPNALSTASPTRRPASRTTRADIAQPPFRRRAAKVRGPIPAYPLTRPIRAYDRRPPSPRPGRRRRRNGDGPILYARLGGQGSRRLVDVGAQQGELVDGRHDGGGQPSGRLGQRPAGVSPGQPSRPTHQALRHLRPAPRRRPRPDTRRTSRASQFSFFTERERTPHAPSSAGACGVPTTAAIAA